MTKRLLVFVSGSALFFFFIIFSYLVDKNLFKVLDFNATVRLQDNVSRRFDDFFSFFSTAGSFEILVILLVVMLILQRKILAGLVTFFLFGLFHIIEIYGKAVVENTPPPQFMLRTKHLVEFPQFHVRTEYSYPSGHSGRTIFISVLLLLFILLSKRIPRFGKIIMSSAILLFDGIMLLSRVYLGEHWLTDVVGGAVLGAAFALVGGSIYFQKTPPVVKQSSKLPAKKQRSVEV